MTSPSPFPSPSTPPSNDYPFKKPKLTHLAPDISSTASYPSNDPHLQSASASDANMEDTEVDLFPAGTVPAPNTTNNNGPQTPPRNDHLNATAPGELSPPRSQGNDTTSNGADSAAVATNGHPVSGLNAANGGGGNTDLFDGGDAMQDTVTGNNNSFVNAGRGVQGGNGNANGGTTWQPGEWRNKKSQEEAGRAWDHVVDQGWRADQLGDVLEQGKRARGLA